MEIVLEIINIIGIISFAAAGAMVAIDKEANIFGVVTLSLVTCFGGGLIRDMIAGDSIGKNLPAVFTELQLEIVICIITALAVFIIAMITKEKYIKEEATVEKINNILDALGIGVFSFAGTAAYLELGFFISVFMGLLTSVGGGMTRDIMLGTIPTIFRKRVYAVACMIGSSIYYLIVTYFMKGMPSANIVGSIACISVIFIIRICATYFRWNMPVAIKFSKDNNLMDK